MIFQKQESYRKGIITSTFLNIVSKGVAFVNSVLLVYLFGTNFGTDSYFLIISTVSFIASFLLGIISYVVVPEGMRIRLNEGEHQSREYINFFFWIFSIIGVLFALLVFITPAVFYSLFSKYPASELAAYKKMLLLSAILFPLNFITNLLLFVLASYKYFTIPMIVSLVNSCISIVLLFALKNIYGITAALVAFAAGFFVNLVWLLYFMGKNLKWNFFKVRKPTRKNWGNIFLMELNIIPVSFRTYINVYMLSGLGAGVITAYNYGMQIALIPELMVISQVSAVMSVKFNELSAKNELEEINRLFSRVMKTLCLGLVPISILAFLLSHEALEILFLFKKGDGISAIEMMGGFMACFALTLPARALDVMVSNIMTAQQKIRQGVLMAIFLHTSVILLTFLAVNFYGLKGFYFLIPFVYLFFIPVFYYFFAKKVLPFLRISEWFIASAKFVLPMVVIAITLFYFKKEFLAQSGMLINIIVVTPIVLISAFLVNKFAKYQPLSFRT